MVGLRDRAMEKLSRNRVTVDLGGGHPFQKSMRAHRKLFEDRRFFSLDLSFERRPSIVGDLLRLPFSDGSLDGIVCTSVLEHLADPWRAAEEIYRVLRPGGAAFVSVPFLHPEHGTGSLPDYYRFTAAGVARLFHRFPSVEIEPQDDYPTAALRFLLGFKIGSPFLNRLLAFFRPLLDLAALAVKGSPIGRGRQATGFDALLTK